MVCLQGQRLGTSGLMRPSSVYDAIVVNSIMSIDAHRKVDYMGLDMGVKVNHNNQTAWEY